MEAALTLLDEMPEVGLNPNTVTFNSLISRYKEVNDMETTFGLHG